MLIYGYVPKSKKRKPNAKQRALQESWNNLLKKYQTVTTKVGSSKPIKSSAPYRRETPHYPSLQTNSVSSCTKKDTQVYTGTSMIGIATLHKSNAVPVFTDKDAKDISSMRR